MVSFGVVPVSSARIEMRGSVHQLVAPTVPPSPRSQTIHELRPQDLAGAPDLTQVRDRLRESLEGRFLLVWFAEIELHFLRQTFGGSARRWRRRTIDVRNLAIASEGQSRDQRLKRGYGLVCHRGAPRTACRRRTRRTRRCPGDRAAVPRVGDEVAGGRGRHPPGTPPNREAHDAANARLEQPFNLGV